MERFPALISSGAANRGLLTTHRFPYTRAPEAFHLLHDHPHQTLGVLLPLGHRRQLTGRESLEVA